MVERGMMSPVGPLAVQQNEGQIVGLRWGTAEAPDPSDPPVLREAIAQLQAYFDGKVDHFDLPLALGPGAFQRRFQEALIAIPFGETRTYGDIAKQLGVSAQAAGQACGANRIPIIVPCHRVLAAQGLGGFSGGVGVEDKVALLRHEGAAGLLI